MSTKPDAGSLRVQTICESDRSGYRLSDPDALCCTMEAMRSGFVMRGSAAVVLLAACSGAPPQSPPATGGAFDMSSLPVCAEQPSPPPVPEVAGLTLPDEATVFSVYEVGSLTQAEGMVEMSPVEVRTYYEQRDDLQLLSVEDERVEAEILVSDGTHRIFVKAQVACATASNFTATVGAEAEAGAMPTPAGSPQPRASWPAPEARPPAPAPRRASRASGSS